MFEEFQGKGLGAYLANHIFEHPDLQVRLFFLGTKTAYNLYRKFGFSALDAPENWMLRRDENRC
ncbi:MAG: GNAT family N-acetyltransferase [Proteobacteria bacterium]|nr:GNAT family N-acetyltransferase [Pseudomonadota bacterium]MBU1714348.1 GNAT family N-acetyltransferase [Pseudomonadota bacterium]